MERKQKVKIYDKMRILFAVKRCGRRILIVNILSLFLLAGCNSQADFYVETEDETIKQAAEEQTVKAEAVKEKESEENAPPKDAGQAESKALLYIYICGAVKKPGVYPFDKGSRVYEAVERAGGFLENADQASVNQAQPLEDGQMIYIKTIGEQSETGTAAGFDMKDDKVNINSADAQQLMTLPGIGQSKADSIIAYRETNGSFAVIEDIMKIEGIKEGVFSKIKDRIKVN